MLNRDAFTKAICPSSGAARVRATDGQSTWESGLTYTAPAPAVSRSTAMSEHRDGRANECASITGQPNPSSRLSSSSAEQLRYSTPRSWSERCVSESTCATASPRKARSRAVSAGPTTARRCWLNAEVSRSANQAETLRSRAFLQPVPLTMRRNGPSGTNLCDSKWPPLLSAATRPNGIGRCMVLASRPTRRFVS